MNAVYVTHAVLLTTWVLCLILYARDINVWDGCKLILYVAVLYVVLLLRSLSLGHNTLCLQALSVSSFYLATVLSTNGHPAWCITEDFRERLGIEAIKSEVRKPSFIGIRTFTIFVVLMVVIYGVHPAYYSFE